MSFLHDFPLILHETIHITIHRMLVFHDARYHTKISIFPNNIKKNIEEKKVDKIIQMGREGHIL